jgi:hypothetical protein
MITAILFCLTSLSAVTSAAPKPPDKVAKILEAVSSIQKDERRDDVFKRLGLWDDEEIRSIVGASGLGQTDEVWDLVGDGRWLLSMVSFTPPGENANAARGGKVVGFEVLYRKTATEKIDWKSLERLLPYFEAGRVVTKKTEAEQGGTGQPATRSQSKSEGGEKPQPEAEGRSR